MTNKIPLRCYAVGNYFMLYSCFLHTSGNVPFLTSLECIYIQYIKNSTLLLLPENLALQDQQAPQRASPLNNSPCRHRPPRSQREESCKAGRGFGGGWLKPPPCPSSPVSHRHGGADCGDASCPTYPGILSDNQILLPYDNSAKAPMPASASPLLPPCLSSPRPAAPWPDTMSLCRGPLIHAMSPDTTSYALERCHAYLYANVRHTSRLTVPRDSTPMPSHTLCRWHI